MFNYDFLYRDLLIGKSVSLRPHNTKEESSVLFVSQSTYPYRLFDNAKIDIKKIIMKEIARIQFQRKSNGKIQKNTIFVVS
jgi:hypothetical protein